MFFIIIISCGKILIEIIYYRNLGEIQRQLEASNAKLVIGTVKTFGVLKEAISNMKKDMKIICIKTDVNESIPNGAIDFNEMIEINSKF